MNRNNVRQWFYVVLKPLVFLLYRSFILFRLPGRRLQDLVKKCESDTGRIINLSFDFKYSFPLLPAFTITPYQVKEELSELGRMVKERNPRYVVEIGTANGGTLFLWCRLSSDNASIVSIDLPGGLLGGDYHYWREPFYMDFKKPGQRLSLLRKDSHKENTRKYVESLLGDNRVDFLFIDGDHGYEGVKRDFELYGPLVRDGGIIAFHDIVPGPQEATGGVPQFWDEIKRAYKSTEIVKDWHQGGCGIGVLSR